MSLLHWNSTDRYEPKLYVGSEGGNGEHIQDVSGWPYSVYRKAAQIGVTDCVICHGIQCFDDAVEIACKIQKLA